MPPKSRSSSVWPSHWPPDARSLATFTVAAVRAVADDDRTELDDAVADLALFGERAGSVHAAVVRTLLEDTHPSGLEGDDVQELVAGVRTRHPEWADKIDPVSVAIVVLGAFGVDIDTAAASVGDNQDPDDVVPRPPLSYESSARYASLVIAQLTDDPRPYVSRALEEIARSETVEMP